MKTRKEMNERIAELEKENKHLEDGLTLAGGEIDLLQEKYVKAEDRIEKLKRLLHEHTISSMNEYAALRRRLREAQAMRVKAEWLIDHDKYDERGCIDCNTTDERHTWTNAQWIENTPEAE